MADRESFIACFCLSSLSLMFAFSCFHFSMHRSLSVCLPVRFQLVVVRLCSFSSMCLYLCVCRSALLPANLSFLLVGVSFCLTADSAPLPVCLSLAVCPSGSSLAIISGGRLEKRLGSHSLTCCSFEAESLTAYLGQFAGSVYHCL